MAKGGRGIRAPETAVYDQQKSETVTPAGDERKMCLGVTKQAWISSADN